MKILEHTATRLKLQRHPTFFSGLLLVTLWIFGATLLSMGVLIAQAVSVQPLTCQQVEATQVNFKLIAGNVLNAPFNTTAIAALQQATVVTYVDIPAYGVRLISRTQEFEFSNSNDHGSQEAIARRLNEFIQNLRETSITLQEDDRGLQVWVSAALALAGLGLAIIGINLQETVTYTFDKLQSNLTLNRRLLFRNHITTYPLNCLKSVYLLGNSDKASTILLEFQNYSTRRIPLTNYIYTHTRNAQQELVIFL